MYFINASTGAVSVKSTGDYTAVSLALAGGNIILVSSSGMVYSVTDSGAAALYLMSGGSYLPAAVKNSGYVFTADYSGKIHLINLSTPSSSINFTAGGSITNPLIYNSAEQRVIASASNGTLYSLNDSTLNVENTVTGRTDSISGGAAGSLNTFIVSSTGQIDAYDSSWNLVATFSQGAQVYNSIALENCIAVYDAAGKISLYGLKQNITYPENYAYLPDLSDPVEIKGTAAAYVQTFNSYDVYYENPETGRIDIITAQTTPIPDGTLASWDKSGVADGIYRLALNVKHSAGANETTIYVSKGDFRYAGSMENEELYKPMKVRIDSTGKIYVLNMDAIGQRRLKVFNSDGTYTGTELNADAFVDFVLDGDGTIYGVTYNGLIRKYIKQVDGSWAGDNYILLESAANAVYTSIDIKEGIIYTAYNYGTAKIKTFDAATVEWRTYANLGSTPTTALSETSLSDLSPTGMKVESNEIYISNQNWNNVKVYDKTNYSLLRNLGTPASSGNTGEGYITYPVHLGVGPNGLIYVVEKNNSSIAGSGNRIQVFTKDGVYAGMLGKYGTVPGYFYNPCGIGFSGNYLYVCDNLNGRVQKFEIKLSTPAATPTVTVTNTITETLTVTPTPGGMIFFDHFDNNQFTDVWTYEGNVSDEWGSRTVTESNSQIRFQLTDNFYYMNFVRKCGISRDRGSSDVVEIKALVKVNTSSTEAGLILCGDTFGTGYSASLSKDGDFVIRKGDVIVQDTNVSYQQGQYYLISFKRNDNTFTASFYTTSG
ncbi:MAG TPA: hypothetical protein PKJ42_04385, partial [Candidatus Goldiibacteriota bacterium]|nr:hypothetical protein [Candidatus Goldiibacteriota bacterium]